MSKVRENNLCFYTNNPDDTTVCADFTMPRYIRRLKRLKEEHPDDVDLHQNQDGSIWCRFPIRWLKIMAPRELTVEQREELANRLNRPEIGRDNG